MKKLFFFALPLLLISCKGVEQYRAGIEELASNWGNTTTSITDFASSVSNDLSNYTKAVAGATLDDAVAMKLKPEQTAAWDAAQKAILDALGAYTPFQSTVNDFIKTWTEKSADVTALTDGLANKKLSGDVAGKVAELGQFVTTANDNLNAWKGTYSTIKSGADAALSALNQLRDSLSAAK